MGNDTMVFIGNEAIAMYTEITPAALNDALRALLEREDSVSLHGYTPAPGLPELRRALAAALRERLGVPAWAEGVYVCCGASAGLAASFRALAREGEEVVALAPPSPELRALVEGAGARLRSVPRGAESESAFGGNTALVLLEGELRAEEAERLAAVLSAAQRRLGRPLYLLTTAPSALRVYDNAVLLHDFSAFPGERLGYLAVSARMAEREAVFAALAGAARACGYVNPPSLMQRAVLSLIR